MRKVQTRGTMGRAGRFLRGRQARMARSRRDRNRRSSLNLGLVASGTLAALLLALGFNMVAPLGPGLDTVCDLAGVASGMLFIGLADGV